MSVTQFTYMIYPHSDIKKSRVRVKHIHRSVVRIRDIKKNEYPPYVEESVNGLKFLIIMGMN